MTKFKGWRTLTLGVLAMIGAAVQAGTGVLTPDQMAIATALLGALTVALRAITNTPMGQGAPKA